MTIREWLTDASHRIKNASLQCADPRQHASQILEAVSGWASAKILTVEKESLPAELLVQLQAFLKRRLMGEPFQYIVGRESFWKDEFEVGPGVLIPRRETEHVVELLASLKKKDLRAVELGAGSGNIGISALRENPSWIWYAIEKSPEAFRFAQQNSARLLGQQAHIETDLTQATEASAGTYTLVSGDFFDRVPSSPLQWDLVVSNPPYVATDDIPTLSREVRHEPKQALDGGRDGLVFVRQLAAVSLKILKSGGWIVLEIGSDQKHGGLEILSSLGYEEVGVMDDLSGLPRVLFGKRKS